MQNLYKIISIYLYNCICKMGFYQQNLGITMFIQVREDLFINMDHVNSVVKREKAIHFNDSNSENWHRVEFDSDQERDSAFSDLMRKTGCLEWKSN